MNFFSFALTLYRSHHISIFLVQKYFMWFFLHQYVNRIHKLSFLPSYYAIIIDLILAATIFCLFYITVSLNIPQRFSLMHSIIYIHCIYYMYAQHSLYSISNAKTFPLHTSSFFLCEYNAFSLYFFLWDSDNNCLTINSHCSFKFSSISRFSSFSLSRNLKGC